MKTKGDNNYYNQSSLREDRIYRIKRVAKTNMIIKLIQYVPALIMLILMSLPLIDVNLIFTEENISILDLFIANKQSENLKDLIACSISADFLGLPYDTYENFFKAFFYTSTQVVIENSGSEIAIVLLSMFLNFVRQFALIVFVFFFIVRGIFKIIPCILSANVENSLRLATDETFNMVFCHGNSRFCVDEENGIRFSDAPKSYSKLFFKWLIGMLIVVGGGAYFPYLLLNYLYSVEYVTVSPILTIGITISVITIFIGQFIDYYYDIKHTSTLNGCKQLKSILK